MTHPLYYLASPYTGEGVIPFIRHHQACLAAGEMLRDGYYVLSPIAHSHPIAQRVNLPGKWDWWQTYDRRLIDACDAVAVLMLDGWRESVGVSAEIAYAQSLGKPVHYVPAPWRGEVWSSPECEGAL
jgi:hypothetical protein